jgi:hypothetical protein
MGWVRHSQEEFYSTNGRWTVSITKGGTPRIHLTPEAAAAVKAGLDELVATEPSKYRNVKVY